MSKSLVECLVYASANTGMNPVPTQSACANEPQAFRRGLDVPQSTFTRIATASGQMMCLSLLSRQGVFLILLSASALLVLMLGHVIWPLTSPPPSEDEVHFLIPAINFADSGSFSAAQMLTPQIYWLPSGFYIVNGVVFFLSDHIGIQLARAVSLGCVTIAAVMLRHVVSAALGVAGERRPVVGTTFILVWYLSLPVVFAGDIARPEALILVTTIAALDCLLRGRLIGSFAFAAISMMVHPLLAFPACAVAACGLPLLRPSSLRGLRTSWWEWLILIVAAGLVAVEINRLTGNFALYWSHLEFQLSRKAARTLGWLEKLSAFATAMAACWAFFDCWRGRARPDRAMPPRLQRQFVLVFGLAALSVFAMGKEMWYFPFLLLGMLLPLCVVLGTASLADRIASVNAMAISVCVLSICAGLFTWGLGLRPRGFFAFHVQPKTLANIADDLHSLKDTTHDLLVGEGAAAVLVDPQFYYSFIGQRGAVPQAFTWTPLSRPAEIHFDHVVVMKRGYPHIETDLPVALLSNYVCLSERQISTPDGRYLIGITAVASVPGTGHAFIPCSSF